MEYAPPAELICRKRGWEWEIALSVPDADKRGADVQQSGKILKPVEGAYPLSNYDGFVTVTYEDGKEETFALCQDSSPLLFKMSSDWEKTIRQVSKISRGHMIAVAPSSWTREGAPRVEPENCVVDGYRAHFFYIETADDAPSFKEWSEPATGGIRLEGKTIEDDSEDGELFIGNPPTHKADKNIVWLRAGPEGAVAPDGWKGTNFKPNEKTLSDIMNGREGRFYLRAYVAHGERPALVDSDQFRYCKDLREIRMNDERYSSDTLMVPGGGGHMPVTLEFIGEGETRIHPRLKGGNGYAQVKDDMAIIESHQRGDETVWILGEGGNEVEIGIHLPRVWWKLDGGDWTDKPISMTRQEFYEKRAAKLTVSLPHFVKDVHAGFNGDLDRKISVTEEEEESRPRAFKRKETRIPLIDFVDYNQIAKPLSAYAAFQIRCQDHTVSLIQVRYSKALREIRVNGEIYPTGALMAPGGGGHMPAKLEFFDEEGERIRPRLKGGNGYTQVQADDSALINPDKRADETVWILDEGGNEVEIGIHLPRVWWKLDGGDWTDKHIVMSRQEFQQKKEIKLVVSLPHFVKDVHAGFDSRMSQKMQTLKEKEKDRPRDSKRVETRFSLLSFADYNEIDKPLSADAFLQIRCSGRVINLIRVTKDEPKKKLDNPDLCAQHKTRRNDGFSRRELKGADLSIDAARSMGCRVDRRRKSCHQHNIDFLKQKMRASDASSE